MKGVKARGIGWIGRIKGVVSQDHWKEETKNIRKLSNRRDESLRWEWEKGENGIGGKEGLSALIRGERVKGKSTVCK